MWSRPELLQLLLLLLLLLCLWIHLQPLLRVMLLPKTSPPHSSNNSSSSISEVAAAEVSVDREEKVKDGVEVATATEGAPEMVVPVPTAEALRLEKGTIG